MKLHTYILPIFLLFSIVTFAQIDDRSRDEKYTDANTFMEDKFYNDALKIWLDILKEEPDNSNINSKVGECYFNSPADRNKALPYFEKAVVNVTKSYNPFDPNEQSAKIDNYFYLGKLYHLENKLDEALEYLNKFKEIAGKKHYLADENNRQIEMVNNAKIAIQSPITIEIESLGEKVNSIYPDYGPVVSLDEQTIFFTSRRLRSDSSNQLYKDVRDGMFFENIYQAVKENGEWKEPVAININKLSEHTSTIGISGDGQTLYLYLDDNGIGNIYQSNLQGLEWSMPVKLGSDINSSDNETHVTVSADEKTLYYVSDRKKGSQGGKDIFFCRKLPNGEWGLSMPLSDVVNTKYDEDGVYIHPNGKTLFFSSRGHNSMGGYDIFYTQLQDDDSWSVPTNIGYPINSTDDDVFYIPSPDGKRAYYSSVQESGFGGQDLYKITQPATDAEALTLLKGFISVQEGEAIPENMLIIVTDNETGKEIARSKPLARNGSFVFIIPPGKNYNLSYESGGTEFYNENVFVTLGSDYNEISKEILLNTIDMTGTLVERPIASDQNDKWNIQFEKLDQYLTEGLKVKFLDEEGNVMFEEAVDKDGNFKYHQLASDKLYILKLESKDQDINCEDMNVLFSSLDNKEAKYQFNHDSNCNLTSSDIGLKKWKLLSKDVPEGLKIKYLDENGNVMYTEEIDEKGYFKYHQLAKDKKYLFALEGVDKDFDCSELELLLTSLKSIDQEFTFDKNGDCGFESQQKSSGIVEPTTEEQPTIIVDNTNESKTSKDQKINKPKTSESNKNKTLLYEEYFTYNKNDLGNEKSINDAVAKVMSAINKDGIAKVSVESSASRVPTKTFGSNTKLTKLRADKAKTLLLTKLNQKGIDASKVKFTSFTTLVQGPRYKGDFIENKATYEKYQYVKIFIK